jgi:CBS domain containing-hemolysin-like protein
MINDVCKMLNLSLDAFDKVRGDSDSLAGMLLELAGDFPKVNEVIETGDFQFTILEVSRNRIEKVQVKIDPDKEIISAGRKEENR